MQKSGRRFFAKSRDRTKYERKSLIPITCDLRWSVMQKSGRRFFAKSRDQTKDARKSLIPITCDLRDPQGAERRRPLSPARPGARRRRGRRVGLARAKTAPAKRRLLALEPAEQADF
jgi:hypothetical protein